MAFTFEQIKYHFENNDHVAKLFGITVLEAHRGYAKISLELKDIHLNGANLAHGGVIFTLADVAFGVAANVEQNYMALTAQASISYIRAGKSGILTAEARVLQDGRKLVVVDTFVYDCEGTLLAVARITGARTSTEIKA